MPLYPGSLNPYPLAAMRPTTGTWIPPLAVSSSSNTLTASTLVYPILIPTPLTVDRIGVEIVTPGVNGGGLASIRVGIWLPDSTLYNLAPKTLLLDAGIIDGELTSVQSKTISLALAPGMYWIGGSLQGTPGTAPILRSNSSNMVIPGLIQRENQQHVSQFSLLGWDIGALGGGAYTNADTMNGAQAGPRVCLRVI